MDTRGRPSINLNLGTSARPLWVSALVDTGAAMSVMHQDVARMFFSRVGRPFLLEKVTRDVVSASGHELKILGCMEIMLPGVGIIKFHVANNLAHKCIIGWDMLHEHGFNLDDRFLQWGDNSYEHCEYQCPAVHCLDQSSPKDAKTLQRLLHKYRSIFGKAGELEAAKVDPMEIHTEGPPVHRRAYRMALHHLDIANEEIDKMLAMGIIRPSSSPYASPVLLVPKKDGTLRFCCDYRKLNSVTVKDRWPLPNIQEIFDRLDAKFFSTMDMRSGYWQVPLAPEAIPKTAFVCHRGQFEWLRVPFGLANAPSHYQRVMSSVLGKFIGKFVLVFLDDIIIYSKSKAEHFRHLELVLQALKDANLTVKESKCNFFKNEVEALGYIVSDKGLRANPATTKAIYQQPPPADVKALQRFMGMAQYYRQLVPDFSKIAEPLNELTRKDQKWQWGPAQQTAFENLKEELISERVMAFPNLNQPFILYTDACDYAVGAILCQEDADGHERPIQYVSAQLSSTQRRWATIEKEAFAVIYALKKLQPYLLGSDCTVYTDHKPLLSFFVGEVKNTKIQRWAILIAEFGIRIKYRPGPRNVRADCLSRLPVGELAVIDVATEWIHPDEAQGPQAPVLADNLDLQAVRVAQRDEFPDEMTAAEEGKQGFLLHQDLLFSGNRASYTEPRYPRLLLPSQFREDIIKRCHLESGHSGHLKTMQRVQEHYVWPGMRKEIEVWYKRCPSCLVHTSRPEHVEMGEMPVPTSPGQIIGADLIGPLVESEYGNRYILMVIDHFSKWVEAFPIPRKTNENVWKALRCEYVPRHGSPRVLITDRGSEFRGKEFEEWVRGNNIDHRRTTANHPQSNGQVERTNRTIKDMLRKLINGNRSRWEDELAACLWAIRTNVSSATNRSPFMLHHARPGRAPVQNMLGDNDGFTFENRLLLQSELFKKTALAIKDSRRYNRERLAEKANAGEIIAGDHVILRANEPVSLSAQWDFAYVVTQVNGLTVDLLHPESGKTLRVHREKVKLVDPDITWDEIHPRPRRQRIRQVPRRMVHHDEAVPRPLPPPRAAQPAAPPAPATPTPEAAAAPPAPPQPDDQPTPQASHPDHTPMITETDNEHNPQPSADETMDYDGVSPQQGHYRLRATAERRSLAADRRTTAQKRSAPEEPSTENTDNKRLRWSIDQLACLDFAYSFMQHL